MKQIIMVLFFVITVGNIIKADIFGTGANQFTIDFVPILGSTNPTSGYGIVNNDYRMGTYEITNDQWNKFKAAYGPVKGNPSSAYEYPASFTGTNVPTGNVSWYEAAQFVNWLNTSTGHQAAYKFTGTQGTNGYTFETWSIDQAAGGTNFYRHKDAMYYLPTEDEWVKAAYWNGASLQNYATQAGDTLFQGNGTNGGWNYYDGDDGPDGPGAGPWNVGSGNQELNGTYDMMGNFNEWMESPYSDTSYQTFSSRGLRGGSSYASMGYLALSGRMGALPYSEYVDLGFRVASIPEPCSIGLMLLGGAAGIRRKRR